MQTVTDRTSNPFGLRPPFDRSDPDDRTAVFGYGDANADFHVIGDHPGVHGGASTGVPFTELEDGLAVQDVLREVGFASGPWDAPSLENCFWSYIHMCTLPDGRAPTDEEYADLERFFDAELRAINAHVLLPVGARATDHVLREYTTQRHRIDLDMASLHARDVRGRGFLVVPINAPVEWVEGDREAIVSRLEALLASDYRQTKGVATTVG
ncbi:uracil-DNA glycosylase family protein [Natrinema longum]|uniref:Uracil-DNA glycosylase n=1 Tax=Natrinema longum TaxID=370324 RepID=A0A8A2UC16_9EURY|nr:uracil-DNA glycosylase family protein [Natrinema longum]MBZ6495899.1 uracil-DNA glycosylase [Natrinema longum]QSW86160.1 uracil-DNA glycosylase [Natrinema longum]